MPYKYPLNEPQLDDTEQNYVLQVLRQGWLSAGGEFTKRFEESFAKFIGVNHALAVQSGTAALHTALLAMGVKPGEKILIPNYTCGACATAVLQAGAEPIIIDIEPKTFGMDSKTVEEIISTQKIKAVMVVHVYGFPCRDFDKIVAICRKHNVLLLEDASEAHGAKFQGRNVGSFGDMAVFSVRSEKMIGVGEGGLVLTDSKELSEKALFYASRAAPHRTDKDPWWYKYVYTDVGMNYRLPHILGAIGVAQIEKFPAILQKKIFIGEMYRKLFSEVPGVRLQESAPDSQPCYWLNCIILDKSEKVVRKIGQELIEQGVEIRPAFWPLSDLPPFKKYAYGPQEKAMQLLRSMIILPSSVRLAEENGKSLREIAGIITEKLKQE